MSNEKRAWCDCIGHIVVNLSHTEHGIDLAIAEKLASDLNQAIEEARQTPFERWWEMQEPYVGYECCARVIKCATGKVAISKVQAQQLFNEIRNAK